MNLSQFVHGAWLRSGVQDDSSRGVVQRIYQAFYVRYNAFHEKRSFRAAQAVVAPSKRTTEELKGIGIDGAKIHIVPNGVDCDEFCPGPPNRTALGLPENVPLARLPATSEPIARDWDRSFRPWSVFREFIWP